jgi:hypothetical protein
LVSYAGYEGSTPWTILFPDRNLETLGQNITKSGVVFYSSRLIIHFCSLDGSNMKRVPVALILLLSIGFIAIGDKIFPRPIGQYSTAIRGSLDNMMISAFPEWTPKTNQYRKTNEAIREAEQR